MKKAKMFFTILLILCCLAPVFSNGQDDKGAESKELTVWLWNLEFNGYAMDLAAKAYQELHPDVSVDVVDIPEQIEAKIEAGLIAGGAGLPDISLFQDFNIEKFVQNYPGSFVDLKAEGVDFNQFAKYKVTPMSEGSAVYGIPFDSGSIGLYLRTDLLMEAGINPRDYNKAMSWEEVIDLGRLVRAKINKPLIAYDSTQLSFLHAMVQSTGAQFFKNDGTLNLEDPAIIKCIEYINTMNSEGILRIVEGWGNYVSAFNNGDSVGVLSAVWMIGVLKTQPENAGNWMAVPTPKVSGVAGAQHASNYGGSSWFVFESSKNKDLAVDFLKTTWASDSPACLDFYNTILKGAGAMGTFLPSRSGSNYNAGDEFFYEGQAVYGDFASWMENTPPFLYTTNYQAMAQSTNNALSRMISSGLSVDEVIAQAQDEYSQITGK